MNSDLGYEQSHGIKSYIDKRDPRNRIVMTILIQYIWVTAYPLNFAGSRDFDPRDPADQGSAAAVKWEKASRH